MSEPIFKSVAVLGSGSFGTALAVLLAPRVEQLVIVGRNPETVRGIRETHRNPHYLKEIPLPEHIDADTRLERALDGELVVFAVPTSATRHTARALRELGLGSDVALLSCAKGIERETDERMSGILSELMPDNPLAVLSGPNHAEEMARNLATCAVIGSKNPGLAARLQTLFTFPHFRSYTSDDVAGIELGGAIKNVYAIATGVAHGLGLGDNAVAALVTRALAELTRLGVVLGGRQETFAGLSGVGDLLVTCFSEQSRNHRVGAAIGQGQTLEQAVEALGMVAEGVPNTLSIYEAARRHQVRTPIIDAVHGILYRDLPAATAMRELLERDPRPECD